MIETAVFSHWSAPAKGRPVAANDKRMWSLSVLKARRFFKKLVLVTDMAGYDVFVKELQLPFDEVHTALDAIPWWLSPIWALGKLMAYTIPKEPFVHIDLDVMLDAPLPETLLQSPCLVERAEGIIAEANYDMCRSFPWMPWEWLYAIEMGQTRDWNCGLVGGLEWRRLHRYANTSLKVAYSFDTYLPPLDGTCLSRFLEQWAIEREFSADEIVCLDRNHVGYFHLQGDIKRRPTVVKHIRDQLEQRYPEQALRCLPLALPAIIG